MEFSKQSPEYRELFRQAEQAKCTCKGRHYNLRYMAETGCTKCCTKLIDQIGGRDREGKTALMESARNGHPEVAKLLIPLETKMQDEYGTTALMISAENGHLEIAKLLIPHEATMQNNYGRTALMESARHGHLEVAKLLIPHEAKMQTKDGETALMLSTQNGHLEIAKLLIPLEAGIKSSNGRTATTIAISEYQRSCFPLLLANDAEREASQIQRIMLAAYDGDIRYLLEHQGDWSTIREQFTALDFALFGSQRRAVRLLVSSEEARRSFAEEFSSRFDRWGPIALARCFLSVYASFMLDIAPVVHMMDTECKSSLLIVALIKQKDNASNILRAVCTPDAELMFQDLEIFYNGPQVTSVLAGLKHVGFSYLGETVESLAKEEDGLVQQYLASNPLKQAQTRRAEKEAGRKLPNEKQACWREIEAESAFNGSLVTVSRDLPQYACPSLKLVPDHDSNRIRQKQVLNNHLLLGAFRFMQNLVQDMLDE